MSVEKAVRIGHRDPDDGLTKEVGPDNPLHVSVTNTAEFPGGGGGGGAITGNVGVLDGSDVRIDPATEDTLQDIETELILIESELDDLETLSTAIRDGDRTLSKRFEWVLVGSEYKPLYIGKALPGSLVSDPAWWVTRWTFADQGGGDYKPVSVESKIGIAWDDRVAELP